MTILYILEEQRTQYKSINPITFFKSKNIKILTPKNDTFIKPKLMFHASTNRNIEIFQPRATHVRDRKEGPVIFATPHIGFASMWLAGWHGKWVNSGSFDRGPFYFVCSNKEKFINEDNGGAIYVLDANKFYYDLEKNASSSLTEWVCKEEIEPLYKLEFESALETMINFGVQVFFVDQKTFDKIRTSDDYGRNIFMSLESENQKRNKNYMPLFDYEKYKKEEIK